ncbi:MAG: ankyrin repeat domain-containing protein [Akkermansia sp.]|nr:ankyrin repeat domain-containing protein [Akkermansia sp.]
MPIEPPSTKQTASVALPEGYLLNNCYIIRKTLGQGSFGITYQAEEKVTERAVIIKENFPAFCSQRDHTNNSVSANLPKNADTYEWALGSFLKEAKLLAHLQHSNIVPISCAFEVLGTAYYVMPHVGGNPLHIAAPHHTEIDEKWLTPVLTNLLNALDYLHEKDLLHRDIKPDNIIINEKGEPILIDFGTARAVAGTHTQTKMGTPGYAPIEQWAVKGNRGPWTDLYALGATCYHLITGQVPPDCHERTDDDNYTPLANQPELQGRFSSIILSSIDKALNLKTRARWQCAQDWLQTLKAQPTAVPQALLTPFAPAIEPPLTKNIELTEEELYEKCVALARANGKVSTPMLQRCLSLGYGIAARMMDLMKERGVFPLSAPVRASAPQPQQILQAARNGDKEELLRLINSGGDINCKDSHGDTPLIVATWGKHVDCVKILLDSRVDVNKTNGEGRTALFCAALAGHTEILQLLLNTPTINVNRQNRFGWTALSAAIDNGHAECVRLLLNAPGIDIYLPNNNGHTPLSIAREKGNPTIYNLMQEASLFPI